MHANRPSCLDIARALKRQGNSRLIEVCVESCRSLERADIELIWILKCHFSFVRNGLGHNRFSPELIVVALINHSSRSPYDLDQFRIWRPVIELDMRAMVLDRPGAALVLQERPIPHPAPGEILIEIEACGVCRTDLHVVDGELPHPKLPIVPGHEIVGRVAAAGSDVTGFARGERVGVPWLGATCGVCPYCRDGRENLCDRPLFTGYTRDGGYATHTLSRSRFCFPT